jgi:hypothetical protein
VVSNKAAASVAGKKKTIVQKMAAEAGREMLTD